MNISGGKLLFVTYCLTAFTYSESGFDRAPTLTPIAVSVEAKWMEWFTNTFIWDHDSLTADYVQRIQSNSVEKFNTITMIGCVQAMDFIDKLITQTIKCIDKSVEDLEMECWRNDFSAIMPFFTWMKSEKVNSHLPIPIDIWNIKLP